MRGYESIPVYMMKSIKFLSPTLIIFFTISCKSVPNQVSLSWNKCINTVIEQERFNMDFGEAQSLDNSIKRFESFLVNSGHLKSLKKADYRTFVSKIVENPFYFKDIFNFINNQENFVDYTILQNPRLFLYQCNDFVLVTEKNDYLSTLNLQTNLMQELVQKDYSDIALIDSLFENTPDEDFSKIMYRIPFIYIVTMNAAKNEAKY